MKLIELAKFAAGVAACQALMHGAFALGEVQFVLFGIQHDRSMNINGAIVWGLVLLALLWFAWGQERNR